MSDEWYEDTKLLVWVMFVVAMTLISAVAYQLEGLEDRVDRCCPVEEDE